jgi:carbon-monoxide dehydrogenase medium subunit
MYPRQFDYVAPRSLDEAYGALGDDAKVMSGGMSLIPLMKMRLVSPARIVDIGKVPGLGDVEDRGDHIAIKALVRHAVTATHPLVLQHAPALAQAAAMTGDVQVRNRGTTCGSLAHVDVAADQPAAIIAHGGVAVIGSSTGTREVSAADFCVDTLTPDLAPDEVLLEIRLPKMGPGEGAAYDKLGRRGGHSDYAVAGVAAWVKMSGGSIVDARVGLTGVGTKPQLLHSVAEALIGTDGSESAVAAAAERAVDGVTVLEDLYGSEEYKAHLAKVFTKRAILQAVASVNA